MIAIITSNTDMNEFDMAHEEIKRFVEDDADIKIVVSDLSRCVSSAKELEQGGAEVIIARGVTAMYLRKAAIKIPVVELPITLRDLSKALLKVGVITGEKKPRVGVVAFHMLEDMSTLFPLLDFDMLSLTLTSEEEIDYLIDMAFRKEIDVLMGGVVVFEGAKRRGMPAVLIQSGRESLIQAVREARNVARVRRQEKRQAEELKAILDYAHEGIMAVSSEGLIRVFNSAAERITALKSKDVLSKPFAIFFPQLTLKEILVHGNIITDSFVDIGKTKVLINCVPVKVNGAITGIVATFQAVTEIEKMEKIIRRNIYSKGLVAKFSFNDIYGNSSLLREVKWKAKEFAKTDSVVLITGETGVGKELFAQSIHRESPRKNAPFVVVNCAALPENLLESELFGYVEGAFTGATRKGKKGLFELAHEGTIFLDEISEIPLSLQGRMLRVLQESEVMRLGHDRIIPIDIRVICATNKDLKKMVAKGAFREDLYWRLNVLTLFIPPLRMRQEDIMALIDHYLKGFNRKIKFTRASRDFLVHYTWPGNVRELANFCERLAVMISDNEVLSLDITKNLLSISDFPPVTQEKSQARALKEEQSKIIHALEMAHGNKTRAAEILGVHRVTLWRHLKQGILNNKKTNN